MKATAVQSKRFRTVVLKFYCISESQGEGLVKQGAVGPISEFLIQKLCGSGPEMCISNKFPGDAVGPGNILFGTTVLEAGSFFHQERWPLPFCLCII